MAIFIDSSSLKQSQVKPLTASLQRDKLPPPHNKSSRYNTKQSDGEVLVMLEL